MSNAERIRVFMGMCLNEDTLDLKGWSIKETAPNLGLYILFLLVTAVHVALGICQVAASLLQGSCDLIAKGLVKVMPTPKEAKQSSKEV